MIKFKFTTILIIILLTSSSYAQQCIDIHFNFERKLFRDLIELDDLKSGDCYRIVIDSINLNLYKVQLEKSDSTLFSTFSTPDFIGFNVENISALTNSLSSAGILAQIASSTGSKSLTYGIVEKETVSSIPNSLKEIIDRMDKEKLFLTSQISVLDSIKQSIDSIYFATNLYLLKSKVEMPGSVNFRSLNSSFNFAAALEKIIWLREKIRIMKGKISEHSDSYTQFVSSRKQIIEEKNLSDNDTKIKSTYSSFVETLGKAEESLNAEKSNQLLSAVLLQDNNSSFSYTSLPQQFNGDIGKLKITIEPIKSDYPLQKYSTEILFPRVNTSYAGVSLSFYGSNLYDEGYSTVETVLTDSTSQFKIVTEDFKKSEFGATLLLRKGFKLKEYPKVGLHFAFGPGISITEKVRPRLLLGMGPSFGKKHMIVLDVGVIGGYTEKLSKAYSTSEIYKKAPEETTVSQLMVKGFVSIGYLFRIDQR